jgi:hypothetical protein
MLDLKLGREKVFEYIQLNLDTDKIVVASFRRRNFLLDLESGKCFFCKNFCHTE